MPQESTIRLSFVVLFIGLLILILAISTGLQALPQTAFGVAVFAGILIFSGVSIGFLMWLVRKLEISEDRLNSIVESTADGIVTVDAYGKIESVNSSVTAILGYRPGELVGNRITVLFSSLYGELDDEPHFEKFLRRHDLHHLGQANEVIGLRRDGSTLHMDFTATHTILGDREVYVIVLRDVTERVLSRQALQESHAGLEQRVQMRTAELEQSNLRLHSEIEARKRTQVERERLIGELQGALKEIKMLSGMLPICANCKKIRDDTGYWNQLEVYIQEHSDAQFSHGLCPACVHELYPEFEGGTDEPRAAL
ncbi:MAG: PAS domain S-box protein [Candidatus Hydrogenedentes bacterium]|nr:PAS domain S-box protein [Candidatus Hydrogenedentota bacterium]